MVPAVARVRRARPTAGSAPISSLVARGYPQRARCSGARWPSAAAPTPRRGARRRAHGGAPARRRRAMTYDVTLIPGDGIGPEITAQTVKVLEATGLRFNWDEELAGMARGRGHRHAAARRHGREHPQERRSRSRVRSPRRSAPASARSTSASARNSSSSPTSGPPSTIVPGGRFENVDIVLVRENLEGLYIGVEHFVQIGDDPRAVAESMAIVTRAGCERIVRYAFEYALQARPAARSPSCTRRTSSRW